MLIDRTIGDILPTPIIRPDVTAADLGFRKDVDGQVDRFLADAAGQELSSTAASMFIELNDIVPTSVVTALTVVIDYDVALGSAVLKDAAELLLAGVGTVILNTLGDPSIFPVPRNDPPELAAPGTLASNAFNQTIEAGAATLEASGAEVIIVDMAAIFAEVEADYSSFGFRILDEPVFLPDVDGECIEEFNPVVFGIPLDQAAFIDSVHSTAALRGILRRSRTKA